MKEQKQQNECKQPEQESLEIRFERLERRFREQQEEIVKLKFHVHSEHGGPPMIYLCK